MSTNSCLVILVGEAERASPHAARAESATRRLAAALSAAGVRVVVASNSSTLELVGDRVERMTVASEDDIVDIYRRLLGTGSIGVVSVDSAGPLARIAEVGGSPERFVIRGDTPLGTATAADNGVRSVTEFSFGAVESDEVAQVIIDTLARRAERPVVRKRVGFLTTWNQRCGLAAYARDILSEFVPDTFVVYAESGVDMVSPDEAYVRRVWSRGAPDFSDLVSAIERDDIGLLHVNCLPRLFPIPAFAAFLRTVRARGIRILMTLHTVFSREDGIDELVRAIDGVCVHFPESRLEAIANGASPAAVHVVPLGVPVETPLTVAERSALRRGLGIPDSDVVVSTFGFIHTHKGMEGVIESVERLTARGISAQGFIIGVPGEGSTDGARYLQYLKGAAAHTGVADRVTFIDRFVADDELRRYVRASDVVLMNYRGDYYEASGACAWALGSGAVVATSVAPQFSGLGDAVWHITAGYPAADSVELIATNPELAAEVRRRAREYAARHAWPRVVEQIHRLYSSYDFKPTVHQKKESAVTQNETRSTRAGQLRVLMQNRPNTLSQRGGDTVVIERLKAGLESRGVAVTLDLEGTADPAQFDIVHLFNFVLADMTRALGERAHKAGIPFVVTTLHEDIASFHNQSITTARALIEYTTRGQDSSWWESVRGALNSVAGCAPFDNAWTARHAAMLFTNGERESALIRRLYPQSAPITEVRLGHEVTTTADRTLFEREYGVKDFILCVGRIESRKNQLMLLKALEHSDLPVVLAGGGFSYQPDYDRAVRAFKRAGRTLVLGRLSPEMLASAYAAAKVHVLPSWYELPGLVSLEAASHGCNVVVTDRGTTRDYFGATAFYCEPNDEISIANATIAAYYAPRRVGVREVALGARWDTTVDETLACYERIVGPRKRAELSVTEPRMSDSVAAQTQQEGSMETMKAETSGDMGALLDEGERAARAHEYNRAHELLEQAEHRDPRSVRALRARGAVFLAEGNIARAEDYFKRALSIQAHDPKTLSGLGMCAMQSRAPEIAHGYLTKALDVAPDQLVAMLQLIECSYALERYDALETALRRYITQHPDDVDMRYCLAGCLFKMGRAGEARELSESVLKTRPDHAGAQQLQQLIQQATPSAAQPATAPEPAVETPLTARIETEVVGPSRTSRPGRGTSGLEESADGAIGAIEELKYRGDFAAMKKSCTELLGRFGLTPEQMERATVLHAESEVLGGELEAGQRLYDQVLTRNPGSARALGGKGALAAHAGDWVGAREYFERALQSQPNYDVALAGMGLCADQYGDTEGAFGYYVRANRANPENSRAILGLMEIGYRTKRFSEMEVALKSYLELHSADLDFVYSLAGCLFVQGKYSEAIEAVERIELFEPQNERARELRRAIEGAQTGVPFNATVG